MLQYSPDSLQWFLLTAANTVGRSFFIIGFLLAVWTVMSLLLPGVPGFGKSAPKLETPQDLRNRKHKRNPNSRIVPGVIAIVIMAMGIVPFTFATPDAVQAEIGKQLSETANFSEMKLLKINTISQSPISESAIVFVGTAKDVDGDPRQFRYTQYEKFGIYEMIGFDKPAVNLKDESFKSTDNSLKIYKGTETPEPEPEPETETEPEVQE